MANNNDPSAKRLDWIKTAATVVSVLLGIILAAYGFVHFVFQERVARLEGRIEDYEQAEDWELSELLQSLGEASRALSLDAADRKWFEGLKERVPEIEEENLQLKTENEDLLIRIGTLEADLRKIVGETRTLEISVNSSGVLIENSHTLGVSYVTSSYVNFYINNRAYFHQEPGNIVTFEFAGQQCVVTTRSIGTDTATFDFYCHE